MNKLRLLLLLVLCCHGIANAQNPEPLYYQGTIDSLYSEILDETRYVCPFGSRSSDLPQQ